MRCLFLLCIVFGATKSFAQQLQTKATVYDGIVVGGYANRGAFLNFTGPSLRATKGKSVFILGLLPSLRFKKDPAFVKKRPGIPEPRRWINLCL